MNRISVPLSTRIALATLVVSALDWSAPIHAATINKANNTTALNVGTSWTGGVVPGSLDIAQWTSTVTTANTTVLGADLTWLGIKIANPGGGTVTINAGSPASSLSLGTAGIDMSTATQSFTLNPALTLLGAQSWNVAASRTLTKSSTTNMGGFLLTLSGAGTKNLTGVFSNGSLAATAGTTTLSGANTFAGGVTLSGGTLNLHSSGTGGTSSALGTGTLTITGGTLGNTTANAVTLSTNNVQNWNGDFSFSGTSNLNLGTGAVTMSANRQITATGAGALIIGVISEAAAGLSLTKTGNGTLILNGANAYSGGTVVNGGILSTGSAGTFGANVAGNNVAANPGGNAVLGSAGALGNLQTLTITSDAVGLGGVGAGYDGVPVFTNARTGGVTTGGVFGVNTTFATALDLAALGGGGMLLGSQFSGTYSAVSLAADAGVYRLGGGTGALTISQSVLTGAGNTVVVGDTRVNGTGTVILTGANDYTGTTTIAAGTLQIGNGGTSGSIDGTSSVINNATVVFNRSDAFSFAPAISGTGGLTKSGAGTLTLSGANTYAGNTLINAGTLRMGAASSIPTGTAMTMGSGSTAAHLDTNGFDLSLASLSFVNNSTAANTVTIQPGTTLSITGTNSLRLGTLTNGTTTNATFLGGGALEVENTGANLQVGQSAPDQNLTTNTETLDLTALGSFTADVNEFRVGTGTRINATLRLSNTSNTITSNLFTVSETAANNGGPALVVLGTGTNVIQTTTLNLGGQKGSATMTFASQAPGSPGTVTITNKTGGAADLALGNKDFNTGAATMGMLDLRGHSANVTAGTVILGQSTGTSSTNTATGTIQFDAGIFTATSLQLGNKTGSAVETATGVLNIGGGSFTVNSGGLFRLGNRTGSAGDSAGIVSLTGGTLTSNVSITDGGQANTLSTVTLDGGTLDMVGNSIGTAAAPIDTLSLLSGTLQNVAEINGGGAVVKAAGAGTNTLILAGTNTFTGAVEVNSGTLALAGTLSGAANLAVKTGTLAGSGSITRPVIVGDALGTLDAFLAPGGAQIGAVATGPLSLDADATFQLQINLASTAAFTTDLVNVTGDLTLTGSPTLARVNLGTDVALTLGTVIPFLDYSGAWTGGTFAGLPDDATFVLGANEFRISYNGADDATSEVVLQAVPEPGSIAILLGGIASVLGLKRNRRRVA